MQERIIEQAKSKDYSEFDKLTQGPAAQHDKRAIEIVTPTAVPVKKYTQKKS